MGIDFGFLEEDDVRGFGGDEVSEAFGEDGAETVDVPCDAFHGGMGARRGSVGKAEMGEGGGGIILRLRGSSQVLKTGTKSKLIRLVEGHHEISCRMDGIAIGLKACFVKKVSIWGGEWGSGVEAPEGEVEEGGEGDPEEVGDEEGGGGSGDWEEGGDGGGDGEPEEGHFS